MLVHGFKPPHGRRGAACHGGQRSADEDAGLIAVGSLRNGLRYVSGHVIRRQLARAETSPGRAQRTLDPVDPERPPVVAIDVPGQEVPAARGVHQAMRLDVASADASSPAYLRRSRRWSRQAAAIAVNRSGSTWSGREPGPASGTVVAWKAVIRCRSRDGSVCWSLVSARSELSSSPATLPVVAVCRLIATATASSSSSSSGGRAAPTPSRSISGARCAGRHRAGRRVRRAGGPRRPHRRRARVLPRPGPVNRVSRRRGGAGILGPGRCWPSSTTPTCSADRC